MPIPTSAQLQLAPFALADSRGRPTVGVKAQAAGQQGIGDVPAGASKGKDEACTVPVEQAMANITDKILPLLQKLDLPLDDPQGLLRLDAAMAEAAGSNFADLGANATLPVSRALWRLGAALRQEPLWVFLRRAWARPVPQQQVKCLFNIFNGGLHALRKDKHEQLGRDRIDIQEIMVVPMQAINIADAIAIGEAIDAALQTRLYEAYGEAAVSRADEAGFTVLGLGDSDVAIGHVAAAIEAAGFEPGVDVKLALDVAASSFYQAADKRYMLKGEAQDSDGMIAWVEALLTRYPKYFLSIEDGLDEDDWAGWAKLSAALSVRHVKTIGDDLFVTQQTRLARGIAEKSAHAVLIKVNQNGTVGGTLAVMRTAASHGMDCVVSHRSGETLDDSIADLAVACGAWAIKSGDPQPPAAYPDKNTWVRRNKYLRLVAIEAEQAARA